MAKSMPRGHRERRIDFAVRQVRALLSEERPLRRGFRGDNFMI